MTDKYSFVSLDTLLMELGISSSNKREILNYVSLLKDEHGLLERIDEMKRYAGQSAILTAKRNGEIPPLTYEAAYMRGLTPMAVDGRISELKKLLEASKQ